MNSISVKFPSHDMASITIYSSKPSFPILEQPKLIRPRVIHGRGSLGLLGKCVLVIRYDLPQQPM